MTFDALKLIVTATVNDYFRDKKIPFPAGVKQIRNIRYGKYGAKNLLDIYLPEGAQKALPTIVNFHGGGWVYGSKEIYRKYCMSLAARGFAVVNFNYRLAPKWKFPAPLEDGNRVLEWVCENKDAYHLDPMQIILIGDSAGAQLTSQYAAIATNPDYAALFDFTVPHISIRAVGLYCGLYDIKPRGRIKGMLADYLGKNPDQSDARLDVLNAIHENYPPAYVVTARNDFLYAAAEPMCKFLQSKGVDAQYQCYGTDEQKEIAHVFHVNIRLPEAKLCNDESCDFFRKHLI